ncbi:glycosyltransferase family 4 protein [Niallia circulans]|uniref:glycosyltransferase family 4 protein n=1 Tax=Niallia circulans TaxID=1397 RepID=UPI0035269ADC
MKKKILLISNMYPDKKNPSFGVFVKRSEEILICEGFEVNKIVLFKERRKIYKAIKYIKHYVHSVFSIIFNSNDIIYVHYASHNALPIIVAKLFKRKKQLVTNVHGSDVVPETTIQQFFQPLVKKMLRMSDKIIVPSKYFKQLVRKKYNLDSGNIYISPSGGIDQKIFFKTNEIDKIPNLDKNYNYIGYVGRVDKGKGWNLFVDLIAKIKEKGILEQNIRFIIVGNGAEYSQMLEKIEGNNLKEEILLMDFLNQEQLRNIYNMIDLFIFPTTREGESLGLVGLEAMACGTPVVGSSMAGPKEYIEHGENGFLFEPGNLDDLFKQVEKYYNLTKDNKILMGENARNTSNLYSKEKVKEQLIRIFNEVREKG